MPLGFDQMEIQVASAGIHIGITGVLFFGTLVMGFYPADLRSFVFCESHDCELGFCHMCFLPFLYVSFSWGFFVRAYSVLFACV